MATPEYPASNGSEPASAAARRFAELSVLQPFGRDICESWHDAANEGHVTLHPRAMDELRALREGERVVLLSAPRAGHGKTHLLGRVASMISGGAVIASLPWQTAQQVSWEGSGRGVLADLAGAPGEDDQLHRVCAGVHALLLRRLIQTGRIPSTDPAQALRVLAQDPMELFSSSGPARVIGDWFRKHFDQLSKPIAEAANLDDAAAAEHWLRAMFDYLEAPGPGPLGAMQALLCQDGAAQFPRFLRLATVWKPVVLVADHMDAFYRDPATGVRVARTALSLAALPRVHVVLSMNQDLWETSFGAQLPSALEDRLNARGVALRGLAVPDAEALVAMRLREAGAHTQETEAFLSFIDLERYFLGRPVGSVSPRTLLRHAAAQWRIFVDSGGVVARQAPARAPEMHAPVTEEGASVTEPMPLFDESARADLQRLAQSLAKDAEAHQVDISHQPGFNPPVQESAVDAEPGAEPESFLAETDAPAPPPQARAAPLTENRTPAQVEEQHSNFQKLRQMLSKLRVANDTLPAPMGLAQEPAAAAVIATMNGSASAEELHARFETVRRELAQTSGGPPLDREAVDAVLRMAGRRFPIVRYDEVELPGLGGRSLPRWSLQGMEVVFGGGDFTDAHYWKTVSTFVAGRIAELGAATAETGDPMPQLKLAVFKTEAEAPALDELISHEVIPAAMQGQLDVVHLDPRSIASIGALREVVREAESGALHTTPMHVLVTLSSELDFFWKRITRPRS